MTSLLRPAARGGANPTVPRALPADATLAVDRAPRPAVGGARWRWAPIRSWWRRLSSRARRRSIAGSQRGAVTVELVGVIPLLVAVTLAMVGVIAVARDQVLAQGAAREGAREAALGADEARTVAAARAALPASRAARVTIAPAGPDRVRVRVELEVRLPFGVPPVTVRAEGVALREPGLAPQPAGP
jgi:hypothetical protein